MAGVGMAIATPLAARRHSAAAEEGTRMRSRSARPWLAAALLAPCAVGAQSLVVESGAALPGGTLEIPVRFVAGTAAVVGFDLRFDFPAVATVLGTESSTGALCSRVQGTSAISILRFDPGLQPLPTQEACRIRFAIAAGAAPGAYAFVLRSANFAGPLGEPVNGTPNVGRIDVLALVPPSVSFMPAPDPDGQPDGSAEVRLASGVDPAIAIASVLPSVSGGDAGTGVAISCMASPGFALLAGATQSVSAGGTAAAIELGCMPGVAEGVGTLSCTVQGLPGGASTVRAWDLACPQLLLVDGFESPTPPRQPLSP